MKAKTLLISILTLSVIIGCSEEKIENTIPLKGAAIPVKTVELAKRKSSTFINASGKFSTKNETTLSFKVGGIIADLNVEEGQKVRKGELLASLNLTEIQTGLTQAELGLEKARRDYERANRLYQDSVATLEQLENATTALKIAEQQVKAVEFNVQYAEIRANQNGFVLKKFANEGQQVAAGTPVIQINGTEKNSWTIKVTMNDRNWNKISVGDKATLKLDTRKDRFPGEVIRKSQSADPRTGGYWIEIKPTETKGLNLASGMFARVQISPSIQTESWEVPYSAVLDADGSNGYVYVTEDGKTAKRIPVILGAISETSIQILEGLENHNKLIVGGSAYLSDQSPIVIQN